MANLFETEVSRSLRIPGWYAIKVPVASRQGISFLNASPFDFIAFSRKRAYSLEAKMCKGNDTSFPLSRLESHQIENLMAFSKTWGQSETGKPELWRRGGGYILISFRKPKPVAYAIHIYNWRLISKELNELYKGRKSIPRSWFESDPRFIKLPRIKLDSSYGWDFSVLKQ